MNKYTKLRPGLSAFKRAAALLLSAVLAANLLAGCSQTRSDDRLSPPGTADGEAVTLPQDFDSDESNTESSEPELTDPVESTGQSESLSEASESESLSSETSSSPESLASEDSPAVTTLPSGDEPASSASSTAASSEAEIVLSEVFSEPRTMYASDSVNVRSGPGTGYERLGHLDRGDEVSASAISENGWYKIAFKGGDAFVSGKYLQDSMPEPEVTVTAASSEEESSMSNLSSSEKTKWIASWGCAVLTPGENEIPKNPSLKGSTLRQQIRPTVGGEKLRLVISNEYGSTPLKIDSMTIAMLTSPKSYKVELDTETAVTYNGKTSFSVPAGKRITTDVIDFEFEALCDIAVSMMLSDVPSTLTCHTASRCSTWIIKGDHVSDNGFAGCLEMTSWYFLAELDTLVSEEGGVIVCLGDSLTDGASVTTNGFSRYTDELARLLNKDGDYPELSVVNMGIGATALYIYGGNIAGTNRANRDVLGVPGVKYCVLLMGINDIGASSTDISDNIIKEYKSIIERCHKNGIEVIGLTITPFKGNDGYYTEARNNTRHKINDFILSEDSGFDGAIDISSVVASKSDPEKIHIQYVSVWNDYLHFNDSGYKLIGKTVYEYFTGDFKNK